MTKSVQDYIEELKATGEVTIFNRSTLQEIEKALKNTDIYTYLTNTNASWKLTVVK